MPRPRDAVLVGGGLSGLSLLLALTAAPGHDVRRLTLVDPTPLRLDGRAWASWTRRRWPVEEAVTRSWRHVGVRLSGPAGGEVRRLDLTPYRYQLLAGERLAELARRACERADVELVAGRAVLLRESGAGAETVLADGSVVRSRWVLDSRPRQPPPGWRGSWLCFTGRRVRTTRDVFDPDSPVLFDFRTPGGGPGGGARFVYTLPAGPREALVEHTALGVRRAAGSGPPRPADAETALTAYLEAVAGAGGWQVLGGEAGRLPLPTHRPRRLGPRTLALGAAGGLVRPSTGYAVERVQRDSAAVVASLTRCGHPFAVPGPRPRHRWLDGVLLDVLAGRPEVFERVVDGLFTPDRVRPALAFLDEDTGRFQEAVLLGTLPWTPFLRSALRPAREPAGERSSGRTRRPR